MSEISSSEVKRLLEEEWNRKGVRSGVRRTWYSLSGKEGSWVIRAHIGLVKPFDTRVHIRRELKRLIKLTNKLQDMEKSDE